MEIKIKQSDEEIEEKKTNGITDLHSTLLDSSDKKQFGSANSTAF
jgi:hypothetical protein